MFSFEQSPDSFRVEERLRYRLSGQGDYWFTQIEKRSMSTRDAKRRLSEMTGAPLRAMRHAGMKDAAATAVQWLSWPVALERQEPRDGEKLKILDRIRHDRPLGIGHVAENRFCLRFTVETPGDFPDRARLGVRFPNFYGPQRFGRAVLDAGSIGEYVRRPAPDIHAISVAQAWLFNAHLRERLELSGEEPRPDDLWAFGDGRRWFAGPLDETMRARWSAGEIAPTGPIFGYKAACADAERAWLAGFALEPEDFRRWGKMARGARRPLFVTPRVETVRVGADGAEVRLSLLTGAYATVWLMRVFMPDRLRQPVETWPNFTRRVQLVDR